MYLWPHDIIGFIAVIVDYWQEYNKVRTPNFLFPLYLPYPRLRYILRIN